MVLHQDVVCGTNYTKIFKLIQLGEVKKLDAIVIQIQ